MFTLGAIRSHFLSLIIFFTYRKGRATLLFLAITLSQPYSQGTTTASNVAPLCAVFIYHLYIFIFHCITLT